MIGIVIVSHSATLAAGVHELVEQMVQGQVPIATAGGSDNPDNPIGTDPMQVMAAIEAVYSEDGVVVLMDMGSALMSAETALEFLLPEQQANIYLCEAPLVEGTMAAAVQAIGTTDVQQVLAEARGALMAKREQLSPFLDLSHETVPVDNTRSLDTAQTLALTIPNRLGLHARPAAKLVGLINSFQAQVTIDYQGKRVNGASINQVVTLGASQGETLTFYAQGPDEVVLLDEIQKLADENFGDIDEAGDKPVSQAQDLQTIEPTGDNAISVGIPVSGGIAIGPALHVKKLVLDIPATEEGIHDPVTEWPRVQQAIQDALAELQRLYDQTSLHIGDEDAEIFQAHMLILQDPELQQAVHQEIQQRACSAPIAWQQIVQQTADTYAGLADPYFQARAQDILDLGQQVLAHLLSTTETKFELQAPAILVADELHPSDVASLDPQKVLGVITVQGGATGHSAILTRSLGIPTVMGLSDAMDSLTAGQVIALDGSTGQVWANPDEEIIDQLRDQQKQQDEQQAAYLQSAQEMAYMLDGKHIEVGANIGSPDEAQAALEHGAEGIGLFRTELIFMERDELPDEETQYAIYCQAATRLDGRPLIIRTLDIGGDKPISYLPRNAEENPFLGWRGIRYCLDNPHILLPQLRAILRASAQHSIKIMVPMVATLDELHQVKAFLHTAQNELEAADIPFDAKLEVGIMIETPAAVLLAPQLAQAVDFFSIGTNDLTQYIMAADRGNGQVNHLVNPFHPAVLQGIQRTTQAAHDAGIWVGICGEMAGNPLAIPLLIGLGLDELSMSASAIPQTKAIIRAWDVSSAKALVEKVMVLESSTEVEALLQNYLQ